MSDDKAIALTLSRAIVPRSDKHAPENLTTKNPKDVTGESLRPRS